MLGHYSIKNNRASYHNVKSHSERVAYFAVLLQIIVLYNFVKILQEQTLKIPDF